MATAPSKSTTRPKLLSADEYMDLPDDGNHYELIHGEMMMSPSSFFQHGMLVAFIVGELHSFVRARRCGYVGIETDMIMGKDLVCRPDIVYVSNRNASIIRGYLYGPPDLVIEITSPGNWQMDVFAKRHEYERFGVREYWVFDIVEARNKVYQWWLNRGKYRGGLMDAREKYIRSRVLKAFSLKLADLWKAVKP